MDSRIVAATIILAITGLGLVIILKRRFDLRKKLDFANTYLDTLSKYGSSGGKDDESYQWMIRHSDKMQNMLGSQGVIASFRPPHSNYIVNNVPIILNFLPQLNQYAKDELLRDSPITASYYTYIRDAILRFLGILEESNRLVEKSILNPLYLFQLGIQVILFVPIEILSSFGLFNAKTKEKAHSSFFAKILSGTTALIVLLSSIVTIVAGWENFSTAINKIMY